MTEGGAMVSPPPWPQGATLDPQEAINIANNKHITIAGVPGSNKKKSDPDRLKKSYEYWAARFKELNENIFERNDSSGMDSPAIGFARNISYKSFSEIANKREYLINSSKKIKDIAEPVMVKSPCLASLERIALHIQQHFRERNKLGPTTQKDAIRDLWNDLKAFKDAASGSRENKTKGDRQQIARGILAARELFDLARRFYYCDQNHKKFHIKLAELFALYMQEGALGVTPPEDSFPHAPLIETQEGPSCRTSSVHLSDTTARRPGFNLVFKTPAEEKGFNTLWRNILIVGGLDNIINPRLKPYDELVTLIINKIVPLTPSDSKPVPPSEENSSKQIRKTKINELNSLITATNPTGAKLLLGLFMSKIEYSSNLNIKLDQVYFDKIYKDATDELRDLIELHNANDISSAKEKSIYLVGKNLSESKIDDTFACLQIQALWYTSRKDPRTLLSWKDRNRESESFKDLPSFTPFVTYLRFHIQDSPFIRILLACTINLAKLETWHRSYNKDFSGEFLDSLDKSGYGKKLGYNQMVKTLREHQVQWDEYMSEIFSDTIKEKQSLIKKAKGQQEKQEIKNSNPQVPQDLWRNIGLINTINPLFKPNTEGASERQIKNAEIVYKLMSAIKDHRLLGVINNALEYTPIKVLIKYDITYGESRNQVQIYAKSHSFERLRLTYSERNETDKATR